MKFLKQKQFEFIFIKKKSNAKLESTLWEPRERKDVTKLTKSYHSFIQPANTHPVPSTVKCPGAVNKNQIGPWPQQGLGLV